MKDIADPQMSPAVNYWFEAFARREIKAALPTFVAEHMQRINDASRERWSDPESQRSLIKLIVGGWAAGTQDKVHRSLDFPDPTDPVVEWVGKNSQLVHDWIKSEERRELGAPNYVKDWLRQVLDVVPGLPDAEPVRQVLARFEAKRKKPRIIAEALYMKNSGEVVRVPLPKYSKLVRSLRRCVAAREVAGFDSVLVIARRRMEYYVWNYRGEWMQSSRKHNRGTEVPAEPFTERELGIAQ